MGRRPWKRWEDGVYMIEDVNPMKPTGNDSLYITIIVLCEVYGFDPTSQMHRAKEMPLTPVSSPTDACYLP